MGTGLFISGCGLGDRGWVWGGRDRWGLVYLYQGVGWGTGYGYYVIVIFSFVLLSFGVSCPVSFLIE